MIASSLVEWLAFLFSERLIKVIDFHISLGDIMPV
jgi:hypothetical protein